VTYLGFDPGLDGGVAVLNPDAAQGSASAACAYVMPVSGGQIDAHALGALVFSLIASGAALLACVEQVGAMPKQGLSSTFKFGRGYGTILGVLGVLRVHTELVTPQRWKSVVLAGTPKDKDAARAWCRRAYPGVNLLATPRCRVPHDGMADALCIAEYARRELGA
jgi:crossover junction endodeoxyribonuclease RuvC